MPNILFFYFLFHFCLYIILYFILILLSHSLYWLAFINLGLVFFGLRCTVSRAMKLPTFKAQIRLTTIFNIIGLFTFMFAPILKLSVAVVQRLYV